jgi:hypothetical protein
VTNDRAPDFDVVSAYPTVGHLWSIIRAGDWPGVLAFFAGLPDEHSRAFFAANVEKVKGSEDFFAAQAQRETTPGLAHTLLGIRYIQMGWDIRTAKRAKHVSAEQFVGLREYLCKAERLLIDATAARSDNVAAWQARLTTSMGLELGKSESHRRYAQLARYDPHNLVAQRRMVQLLCTKWSGTVDAMFAFARECVSCAPPGDVTPAVIVEAHIERCFDEETDQARKDYFRGAYDEVCGAADRSVWHPDFRPQYGWVAAHNLFAFFFVEAGDHRRAKAHFDAIGNLATDYPWSSYPDKARAFVRGRSAAWRGAR